MDSKQKNAKKEEKQTAQNSNCVNTNTVVLGEALWEMDRQIERECRDCGGSDEGSEVYQYCDDDRGSDSDYRFDFSCVGCDIFIMFLTLFHRQIVLPILLTITTSIVFFYYYNYDT